MTQCVTEFLPLNMELNASYVETILNSLHWLF